MILFLIALFFLIYKVNIMIISFFISIYIKKAKEKQEYILKLLIIFEKAHKYYVFKIYLNDSIIHNS